MEEKPRQSSKVGLTEKDILRVFDDLSNRSNPDAFVVSSEQLDFLKKNNMVRHDRVKCSWELIYDALTESIKEREDTKE